MSKTPHRLRLLATSDVHMHIMAHDYYADTPRLGGSLSALCPVIETLRAEAKTDGREVLLLDNGDFLQGTPLADLINEKPEFVSDLACAIESLGYDAMGLGNHDLDYGLELVDAFVTAVHCPIVSSNLVLDASGPKIQTFTLIERGDVTIGVVSVLPPQTVNWTYPTLGGHIDVRPMETALQSAADSARAAGADIVVALAHSGLGEDPRENALDRLAKTGAVDALIGGHSHQVFPDPNAPPDAETGMLHGIPAVLPGFSGAFLGCIDLDIDRVAGQSCRIVTSQAQVVPAPVPTLPCAPPLTSMRPAHDATRAALNTAIGTIDIPLISYFSQVAPSPILALCASTQIREIDIARADTPYAELPLIAAVSPPRAGGRGGPGNYTDIPAGTLTARNLADLTVFENNIWAMVMTGAELRVWLERSASSFNHLRDGTVTHLLNPEFPSFDFDCLFGLRYELDPTQPARYQANGHIADPSAQRVSNVILNGDPLTDDQEVLVALTSFRACGGGDFPGMRPERPVLRPTVSAARALQSHITNGFPMLDADVWTFAAAARGHRSILKTGPGALQHLDQIAHLAPGTPEPLEDGFVAIPVTL